MRVAWLMIVTVVSCKYEAPPLAVSDGPPTDQSTDVPIDTVDASKPARITNGLVSLWTFDENGGALVGDSSNLPAGAPLPIDLTIADTASVTWLPEILTVNAPVDIRSSPNTRLPPACKTTNEVTFEAWVTPANATQMGAQPPGQPTRIATLTVQNISAHLIGLGQQGASWVGQVRTSGSTDVHGGPLLSGPAVVAGQRTHVVLTSSLTTRRLFVDGVMADEDTFGGDLAMWSASFILLFGGDPGLRNSWTGELHLAAAYDRALSPVEVMTNFQSGP